MLTDLGLGQHRFCWHQNKRFGLNLEHFGSRACFVLRKPSNRENIPPHEAGCGLNDVALDCGKASLGGKNPEPSVAQVAFGPFEGFRVVWSDEHAGQAVAALIQGAAIPVLGELGEDWSGAGDVLEGSNL
jgi:hypothetical protein